MTDQEKLESDLQKLQVRRIHVRYALRRSVKTGETGYITSESEVTWELEHPDSTISPDLAHVASLHFMPALVKKVNFDLVVAGVLSQNDAKERITSAKLMYEQAARTHTNGTNRGTDQNSIHGTGESDRPVAERSSTGIVLPEGKDHRVPSETGPSIGSSSGSETTSPSSEDPRP